MSWAVSFHLFIFGLSNLIYKTYLIRDPGYKLPVASRFKNGSRPGAHTRATPITTCRTRTFLGRKNKTKIE